MGLRTVVTYNPAQAGRALRNDRADDPWGVWKRTKVQAFQTRQPLYMAFVAGFVLLLFAATRGAEPWMACAMGAMMIAVRDRAHLLLLLVPVRGHLPLQEETGGGGDPAAATASTGFIDWAPTKYLPRQGDLGELEDVAVARRAVHVHVGRDAGRVRLDPVPLRVSPGETEVAPAGADDEGAAGAPHARGAAKNPPADADAGNETGRRRIARAACF